MTPSRLFTSLLLGSSLALTPHAFAAQDAKAAPSAAGINEHDRLVQEFMAERAKLLAAREQLTVKAKQAKKDNDAKSLKEARDAATELERDFKTRHADLARQIKAKEDEKKLPRPGTGKPSSG